MGRWLGISLRTKTAGKTCAALVDTLPGLFDVGCRFVFVRVYSFLHPLHHLERRAQPGRKPCVFITGTVLAFDVYVESPNRLRKPQGAFQFQ